MTGTASENKLLVDDVVAALTGRASAGVAPAASLVEQTARAESDLDRRSARAFGRTLLEELAQDPSNLRQLEALIVLGIAHPEVLREHRISLADEGRRLAVMLERAGEIERARDLLEILANQLPEERTIDHELAGILRRSGNTEELIERYLGRAEECVKAGRIGDAIPWLQEVLLLDRTRRDVARMIRDLRFQESERQQSSRRRNRVLVTVLAVSALLSAVFARERRLQQEYAALVQADASFPDSLYARQRSLSAMIDDNLIWTGLFQAKRELRVLGDRVHEHEEEQQRLVREQQLEEQRMVEMAESARVQAILHFDRGEYEEALADFKRSLAMSRDDWVHREKVQKNIEALEAWDGREN